MKENLGLQPRCQLVALLILCSGVFLGERAFAQSLEIVDDPQQPIQGYYDDGNDLSTSFYVKNTSGTDLEVGAFRRVVDSVQGSENRFCWSPTCWPPSVDTANAVQSISANGGVDSTFVGYYTPNSNPGVAAIEYCFYDTSDFSDSTCTTIYYDATNSVSIAEREGAKVGLRLSPNPADERLTINVDQALSGTIRLRSILGETVMEQRIKGSQKEIELDVSKLQEGLHFLTIDSEEGGAVTKKLMIRN